MDDNVQCGRNKINHHSFKLKQPCSLSKWINTRKGLLYTLLDLPAHGEQIELSPIFIGTLNHSQFLSNKL